VLGHIAAAENQQRKGIIAGMSLYNLLLSGDEFKCNALSIVQLMVMLCYVLFCRYSFTVCSNVLVYLVTWLVLHVTGENDAQIGPGDEGKFQVNYV
jgi:hypothetical protein